MAETSQKIALYGFERFKIFPVISDTYESYEVGIGTSLPHVQEATISDDRTEASIYADNVKYMELNRLNARNFALTIAELTAKQLGMLEGGTYDEGTGEYTWGPDAPRPTYAFNFAINLGETGGYRLIRYYVAQVTSVAPSSYSTAGDTLAISPYVITFSSKARLIDKQMTTLKDILDADGLTWLNSIPTKTASGF